MLAYMLVSIRLAGLPTPWRTPRLCAHDIMCFGILRYDEGVNEGGKERQQGEEWCEQQPSAARKWHSVAARCCVCAHDAHAHMTITP